MLLFISNVYFKLQTYFLFEYISVLLYCPQLFRRTLVRMFESQDLDCVFMETHINPRKRRHMVLECIPLPRELGDMAPIYFKVCMCTCFPHSDVHYVKSNTGRWLYNSLCLPSESSHGVWWGMGHEQEDCRPLFKRHPPSCMLLFVICRRFLWFSVLFRSFLTLCLALRVFFVTSFHSSLLIIVCVMPLRFLEVCPTLL